MARDSNLDDDPLEQMPPASRPSRTAKPGSLTMPAPGSRSGVGAGIAASGASNSAGLIQDMMLLEKLVGRISKKLPALTNVASPFIQQMRDLGAAALADQSTGGMGATNPEAMAPPPMEGAPAGPGAAAGMMPPPPPVL